MSNIVPNETDSQHEVEHLVVTALMGAIEQTYDQMSATQRAIYDGFHDLAESWSSLAERDSPHSQALTFCAGQLIALLPPRGDA